MENIHSHKFFFSFHLLFFQFSSLSLLSSAYTLPQQYFINCGSDSNTTLNGRNFVGDFKSGSFGFSTSQGSPVKDNNPLTPTSPLYQTARIFTKPSWYELHIVHNGTYVVRLHLYPFSSPKNLFNAHFNFSASGFSLLSNFRPQVTSNSPIIKEFLLSITAGSFRIYFTPSQESSFAFVNAMETFLAPLENSIRDVTAHVTPAGINNNYIDLPSLVLHTINRINVGGVTLTPDNDSLWRTWVPDDDYLFNKGAAKNSDPYIDRPKYQNGGATEYSAPDFVYKTAKELNIDDSRPSDLFNITWRFNVSKNATYLVRGHFCDVISPSLNFTIFNFYIHSKFSMLINSYEVYPQLAAPFYYDFLVDSDDSGVMNIGIGPRGDSFNKQAFMNGLEIMEVMMSSGEFKGSDPKNKRRLFVIVIGSVVGGVAFVSILVVVILFNLKCRKAKPVETLDLPSVPLYRVNSYSGFAGSTVDGSAVSNLNLGLKVPFAEILYATNNFDAKLMVGRGGFGKVYKGNLRNGLKVAVKRSEPGHGQGFPEFQAEILILSKIRHRHLVSLIGYCDERSEMILVYELMEMGTLRDHLYNSYEVPKRSDLSWNRRLEICIGAAKGLHYLHTCSDGGIIHRDVKSTNILLDEHYVAKVADFGLSKSGPPDQTHVSTDVKGSYGYLDPEYFRFQQLTQKSDVYSFGVVLLEVLCARPVINTLLPPDEVNLANWGISRQKEGELEKIVDPLLAGKIGPNSMRKFGETVEKCLKECGADRPTMNDVLWDLEYALQLQQTTMLREPHGDSTTTDASWELPLPVVHRLPSHSIRIHKEDELPLGIDCDSQSHTAASDVFSQLRIDEPR